MTGRIYVRCLAAYNNGILHGKWIDTSTDEDEMLDEIKELLRTSPIKGAEEWAIHDYEDFPASFGEYPSLKKIAHFEDFIEENKHVIREDLIAIYQDDPNNVDMERLAGIFEEFSDYSNERADEMLAMHEIPDEVRGYFDYDAYERDMKLGMHVIDVPSGVAVFYQ
ncbi:antirestriction protein ArdA [Ensifer sp. ENS04]|uniref:antirestriction protein ArdA n=1 Tax=Ensifer sp. ENS04 TaxID=2769281 RepID=UPI00178119BA|nr:antirestriction protein ArdA [Ensifer sp. ENS04]MBD9544319.1 antirestriction protein ArdA [Ensifer sp. ENS04]